MDLRKILSCYSKKFIPFCRHCINPSVRGQAIEQVEQIKWQNFNACMSSAARNMRKQMNLWTGLFSQQCSLVASQRLRRAYQILMLYRNLYGEKVFKENVKFHLNRIIKKKPLLALLSASFFQWEKERVTDKELESCLQEMEEVHKLVAQSQSALVETNLVSNDAKQNEVIWETVVDKEYFKVWRRYIPETQLYEYRVFGHFTDIPPRAFFNTQVDVGYWKDWDKQTMEVKIMDRDVLTNSEVVHWVYKFPYPMYARDYLYVRRHMTYLEDNVMVITARATEHPSCPVNDKYVRVATYSSQMVISPYTKFDENGFTYVMTYCDDPKTNFPTVCYNWMASTGVHEFLERVHAAAKKKHEKNLSRMESSSSTIYGKMIHQ